MRVGVWVLSGWLGCGAALGSIACGSSSGGGGGGAPSTGGSSSAHGGNAGTSGSSSAGVGGNAGRGSAGSAGSGGGLVLGDSKTEACIAYAIATCERSKACEGRDSTAECIFASLSCPDLVFSDGATRTVAGLKACAEDYKTFPCDKLENGELPACVTAGMRKHGDSCVFSSQCASLACKSAGNCGVCAVEAAAGQACTAPDVECGGALLCNRAANRCEPDGRNTHPQVPVGRPCQVEADCPGLDCPSATHLCTAYPTLGMSCAENKHCGIESYCDLFSKTCTLRPGAGTDCGVDLASAVVGQCALDSICNPVQSPHSVKCAKVPSVGEPCLTNMDSGEPLPYCAGGARCDESQSPPRCVAPLEAGAPCLDRSFCKDGLQCECPEGSSDCATAQVCSKIQLAGEPCGTPATPCHPGFSCTNGACVPLESRATFAKNCPG